jgi:hypothetical protein
LREWLDHKERQRQALEQNVHELMENLRNAAIEAGRTTGTDAPSSSTG